MARMSRAWIWLQVLGGWLPVWVLYSALIAVMHDVPMRYAALMGAHAVLVAAILGFGVHRLARRVPWPRPFRLRFALVHIVAAPAYAVAWIIGTSLLESVIAGHLAFVIGPGLVPFSVMGIWLYIMVAGISYAIEATARAAHAEANAARMQLAALRAQLHPHFLFNALHTVVQLIPIDPSRAQDAAELLAGLLRTAMEERDVVSLRDEWAFVSRYLELERIRFGDRLRVHADLAPNAMDASVPSFALQTLVENAVRHGAAPRVDVTDVFVSATNAADALTLTVRDTGDGAPTDWASTSGTGLARLRERLVALYGGAARLTIDTRPGAGWSATVVIPVARER